MAKIIITRANLFIIHVWHIYLTYLVLLRIGKYQLILLACLFCNLQKVFLLLNYSMIYCLTKWQLPLVSALAWVTNCQYVFPH